jgi:hypothetical protein
MAFSHLPAQAPGCARHIFQRPGEKMRVAILVTGRKRSGKDIVQDECLRDMIGQHMYFQTANIKDDLLSKHSDAAMNCIYITADEVFSGDTFCLGSKLKNYITVQRFHHEPKGLKKVFYNHRARLYMTANQLNSIPEVDGDEMRFFILEVSDRYRAHAAYFKPLVDALHDDGVRRAFYDYLMSIEITTDFDDGQSRPVTNVMLDIKGMNLPYQEVWLAHWVYSVKIHYDNPVDKGIIKLTGPQLWQHAQNALTMRRWRRLGSMLPGFPLRSKIF